MIYLANGTSQALREHPQQALIGQALHTLSRPAQYEHALSAPTPWAVEQQESVPFDPNRYRALLRRLAKRCTERERRRCLFVLVPCHRGSPAVTSALWGWWSLLIRAMHFPLAYAAQEGTQPSDLPWDDFQYLYLLGSANWLEAVATIELANEAHWHGKKIHVAGVDSERAVRRAGALRATSISSSHFRRFKSKATLALVDYVARYLDTEARGLFDA